MINPLLLNTVMRVLPTMQSMPQTPPMGIQPFNSYGMSPLMRRRPIYPGKRDYNPGLFGVQ